MKKLVRILTNIFVCCPDCLFVFCRCCSCKNNEMKKTQIVCNIKYKNPGMGIEPYYFICPKCKGVNK